MPYVERSAKEPLADHLLRNAEGLALTSDQISRLRRASVLSRPAATWKEKLEAQELTMAVNAELSADLDAVEAIVRSRGETLQRLGPKGALRVSSRDGLVGLYTTGKLTRSEYADAMAYRMLFEQRAASLGSQLEDFGRIRSGGSSGAQALLRVYAGKRLDQVEAAVSKADVSGRSLVELRALAGEGEPLRSLASGENARKAVVQRLKATLLVVNRVIMAPPAQRGPCESRAR